MMPMGDANGPRDVNGPHEISTLHRGCDCCRISCDAVMPMGPMKSVRFIGAVTAVGYPARDANGPHEISTLHRGCDCCRISCP